MLSSRSRILVAVAAALLLVGYWLPLWRIQLLAPQYPEGLGMEITVSNIQGVKPNDLQNINGLNHYIGMAKIEPESIPELKIMPWILAALIAGAVLTVATRRRRLLYAWTTLFVVVSLVGLADFYKWEYDYGHNLDPTAAIQVPGLNYQPPLIGGKQILNFTAESWPAGGGWALIAAAGLAVLVSFSELRATRRTRAQVAA